MERCLRGRWHDVSVSIYGSAGSGLRVGASSDVDMCAFFPQHHRWGEKVHALLRGAEAALLEVEAVEPEVVAQLAQLDKAERSLRQLHSGMRERGLKQERLSEKLRGGEEPAEAKAKAQAQAQAQAEAEAEAEVEVDAEAEVEAEGAEAEGAEEELSQSSAGAGAGGGAARGRRAAPRRGLQTMELMAASLAEVEARLEEDGALRTQLEAEVRLARAALAEATRGLAAVRAAREAVEEARKQAEELKRIVFAVGAELRRARYDAVEPVARARTAVVKCVDPHAAGGELACDVVVNNQLALHNTALLRAYMAAFPGARPLCVLIKAWAARRNLNKAAHGTLSSYAHVLTLIHYLQAGVSPPLLPDLCAPSLVPPPRPDGLDVCDGLDVRFCLRVREACAALAPRALQSPPPPLPSLLRGYFEYMCAAHDEKRAAVTLAVRARGQPAPGGFLLPRATCWPRAAANGSTQHRLSIEDPFETWDAPDPTRRHDVAATLSPAGAARLRQEWGRAARLLAEAEASPLSEAEELLAELMAPLQPGGTSAKPNRRDRRGGGGGRGGRGGGKGKGSRGWVGS